MSERNDGPSFHIMNAELDAGDIRAAQAEFRTKFPAFCATLGITQPMLAKLPTQVAEMLVMMRMFNMMSIKLVELDARLRELEPPPPHPTPENARGH